MLLISLFIMSVLFGIGWVVMYVVNNKVVTPDSLYIKMLLVTSIMTFFAVIILYLSDRFSAQRRRRS